MRKNSEKFRETRPCGDCRAFDELEGIGTYCRKHTMRVLTETRVAYLDVEGTCFEEKTQEPAK